MVVSTTSALRTALDSSAVHIVLEAGVYDVSDGQLSLSYAVTIEAEVAGTVVLDASQSNRVLYITGTGVELVGLNITGGYASYAVSAPKSNPMPCSGLEPSFIPKCSLF